MKKKIIIALCSVLTTLSCFAFGCTPKAEVAWVESGDVNFSIKYSFITNVFDGSTRNLTVKDMQAFEEYLTTVDGYDGKMQLADSEKEAFMYTVEGTKFYIANINDDVYYMSACSYTIYSEKNDVDNPETVDFVFPPVSKDYVFSDMSDLNLEVIQNWDYFCNFYSDIEEASIDNLAQTIVVNGKYENDKAVEVTLKYENYIISYSFEINGEN